MFRHLWFCAPLFLLIAPGLSGQNIPPKASLGVFLDPAPAGSGAVYQIKSIVEGSTAEKIGMLVGDQLLAVNDQSITEGPELFATLNKLSVGDPIIVHLRRDGQEIKLPGNMLAKKPLSRPGTETLWREVPFRDGHVRAIVNKPEGAGPFRTIYFLPGYPCQTVNWANPQMPFVRVINHWVDRGYAVVRVEKPGVGECINCPDCKGLTFDDELEVFENGFNWLAERDYVDRGHVVLYGHYLGGRVAPYLASQFPVKGVIVYGNGVDPWQDYLLRMTRNQQPLLGGDYAKTEEAIRGLRPLLHGLFTEERSLEEMRLGNPEKNLLREYLGLRPDGSFFDRSLQFWQSLNAHNFAEYWQKLDVPVLALYGSNDVEALGPGGARRIAAIVNRSRPGRGQFHLVAGADHSLVTVPDKLTGLKMRADGSYKTAYLRGPNEDFIRTVDKWLDNLSDTDHAAAKIPPKQESSSRSQAGTNPRYVDATPQLPPFVTDRNTMDVKAHDLDGDGAPELILAVEGHANILFHNDGHGNFTHRLLPQKHAPKHAQLTGEDSEDVRVADLDGDGDPDLLFATEDTDHHELFWNDGKGNFQPADYEFPKQLPANALAILDVNRDGSPDVLFGNRGRNGLFLNRGNGTFRDATNDYWPVNEDHTQDLKVIDVDGDGHLDVIEGAERGGSNLYLWRKDRFVEATTLPDLAAYETRKITAADVNDDGLLDLFLSNVGWDPQRNAQNLLLLQEADGSFTDATAKWLPEESRTTLDAAFLDLDDDAIPELITANGFGEKNVVVYARENDRFVPREGLLPPTPPGRNTTSLLVADLNGDDLPDLYLGNFQSSDQFFSSSAHR